MVYTRKWTRKDGTICIRVYEKIGGQDAVLYRRAREAVYRERKRQRKRGGAPPQSPRVGATRMPTKVQRVPAETVARMRELHSIGLNFVKLGKHFGVSRYVAEMAVLGSGSVPQAAGNIEE
jgi:hypothetical protein